MNSSIINHYILRDRTVGNIVIEMDSSHTLCVVPGDKAINYLYSFIRVDIYKGYKDQCKYTYYDMDTKAAFISTAEGGILCKQ